MESKRLPAQLNLPGDQRTDAEQPGEVEQIRAKNNAVACVMGAGDKGGHRGGDLRAVRAERRQQTEVARAHPQPPREAVDPVREATAANEHKREPDRELDD